MKLEKKQNGSTEVYAEKKILGSAGYASGNPGISPVLFTMHKGYFSAFSTDYAISYFSTMALQSRQHPIFLKFKQFSVVCLVFGLQMMPGGPVFGGLL